MAFYNDGLPLWNYSITRKHELAKLKGGILNGQPLSSDLPQSIIIHPATWSASLLPGILWSRAGSGEVDGVTFAFSFRYELGQKPVLSGDDLHGERILRTEVQ